jgi:hypothetical protein
MCSRIPRHANTSAVRTVRVPASITTELTAAFPLTAFGKEQAEDEEQKQ